MDLIPIYVKLILKEREWSWTLIGALYLLVTIFIHLVFFQGLTRETKQVDSNLYPAVRSAYLKHSLAGWILYFLSFLFVIAVWIAWKGRIELIPAVTFCLVLPFLFFLSLLLHMKAYAKALLSVLRRRTGIDKEF